MDAVIAALLAEREGYVRRGLADRVAAVDEQLALAGHEPPASDAEAAPRGRRPARRVTGGDDGPADAG